MKKVRCLQSFYYIPHNTVLNFNDELNVSDEAAEKLLSQGLVDILGEEQTEKAEKKVAPKKPRKPRTPKAKPQETGEK